jgi:PfaD family protein
VIAKVSRVEVATQFLSPAPEKILRTLVERGQLSEQEAKLAARVPVAQDLTAEADSGGHTDNRPALALLPSMLALRDRIQEEQGYAGPPRVGLAGGISTPSSAAAAFAMGAAWIVTGSVNQACVESGSSDLVRAMLAEAQQADCVMAPAADMFEMGVKLQVLKRGTMFPMRAQKLYELYKAHGSLDEIPAKDRASLEKTVFREGLDEAWQRTKTFWLDRDARQVERAERDEKHRMALTFRAYLGLSSRWANAGVADRKVDYQVWCGPVMGAFNEWARGSELEAPENRRVADVALNLLHGAAVLTRARSLRAQGAELPPEAERATPLPVSRIHDFLGSPS